MTERAMRRGFYPAVLLLAMLAHGAAAPAHGETIRVMIKNLVNIPAEVKARVGDTVEWVNSDFIAHTATVRGEWDVVIPPSASATHVMEKAGVADYICRFHPNMKGRIVTVP
jgi:plastocyanin